MRDRDKKMASITSVTSLVGGVELRTRLSCLYVSAGLGRAQDIKRGARTSRLVAVSIVSQVEALKRVLPLLNGPDAERLIQACHGR